MPDEIKQVESGIPTCNPVTQADAQAQQLVTQGNNVVQHLRHSVEHSSRLPGVRLDPYTRRAVRIRLFHWVQTKPERRIPATLKELAIELGVSRSHLTRLQHKLPQTKQEFIEDCELQAVADYADILDATIQSAKSNSKDSAQDRRLLVTEVIKPLKSAAVKDRKPDEGEQIIRDAIRKMVEKRKLAQEQTQQLSDGKTIEGTNADRTEIVPTAGE